MATDYFASLGFQPDKGALNQNIRIRKYLRNHKGSVTKQHKASLKKKMAANTARRNPTDPTTGLPVADLTRTAQQASRTKYGSTRQMAVDAIDVTKAQIANVDPYFSQYANHLNSLGQEAINNSAIQQQQILDTQAQAQQQGQAGQNAITQQAQGNPQAQQATQAQADAAAGRQQLAQTSANAVAERGQIRGDMFKAQSANTGLAGAETKARLGQALTKKQADLSNLDQIIGDYFNGNLDQQKSAFLDNRLKQAALDLQGKKLKLDAADKSADNARADAALQQKTANDAARTGIAQQNADTAASNAAKKGSGGASNVTPAKATSNHNTYTGGRATARQWIKSGKVISQSAINKDVKNGVIKKGQPLPKANVDHYVAVLAKKMGNVAQYHDLARAAMMDAIYGGVDQKTRDQIKKQYGITLRLSHSAKVKAKGKK